MPSRSSIDDITNVGVSIFTLQDVGKIESARVLLYQMQTGPTSAQQELFSRIVDFTVATISHAWVLARTRSKRTNAELARIFVRPIQTYYNWCAAAISTREDPTINRVFDDMMAVGQHKDHPHDLLCCSASLCVWILSRLPLDLSDDITEVREMLTALAKQQAHTARNLRGCEHDPAEHIPVSHGEVVFEFAIPPAYTTAR